MDSNMIMNVELGDLMGVIYEEFDEELIRESQNEIFSSMSYLEYLYLNQEFASQQVNFKSSRYFKNIVRNKYIYEDYGNELSPEMISTKYNLSNRRIGQIIN